MSHRHRPATALLVCLALWASSHARADGRPDLTKTRPCGPASVKGPLSYLIPQRFLGADFRPACAAHDANYVTPHFDKGLADARFRADLTRACESSRFPLACRAVAGTMARAVERHGDSAFQQAQAVALAGSR